MSCAKITMMVTNIVLCMIGLSVGVTAAVLCALPRAMDDLGELKMHEDVKVAVRDSENNRKSVMISLAILGFFTFFVSFYGCLGAACENVCALSIYIALIIVIMLACFATSTAALIIPHSEKFRGWTDAAYDESFNASMKRYPNVSESEKMEFAPIDKIQRDSSCCGCHNSSEYKIVLRFQAVPKSCYKYPKDNLTHTVGCCPKKYEGFYEHTKVGFLAVGSVLMVGFAVDVLALVFAFVACDSFKKRQSGGGGGGGYSERTGRRSTYVDAPRRPSRNPPPPPPQRRPSRGAPPRQQRQSYRTPPPPPRCR